MAGWTPGNGTQGASQTKLLADINITPMVDVMLVLLVIFMVTAPLLVAGVPVELPKNTATRISQPKKPVIVTLAADSSLFIRDERIQSSALVERLSALRASEGDTVVYVRADKKIPYGEVMDLLARVGNAGYQRISLLSQPLPQAATPPSAALPPAQNVTQQ